MDSVERELLLHQTIRLMRVTGTGHLHVWYPVLGIRNNQIVMDREDPCNMPDVLLG